MDAEDAEPSAYTFWRPDARCLAAAAAFCAQVLRMGVLGISDRKELAMCICGGDYFRTAR